MKLKYQEKLLFHLKSHLTIVLNLLNLICLEGYLPRDREIDFPERYEGWWRKDPQNDRYILAKGDNNFLDIREKGENFIIVEYHTRYDRNSQKENSVNQLLSAWLDYVEILKDE